MKKTSRARRLSVFFGLLAATFALIVCVIFLLSEKNRHSQPAAEMTESSVPEPLAMENMDTQSEELTWNRYHLKDMKYGIPTDWSYASDLSKEDDIYYYPDQGIFRVFFEKDKKTEFSRDTINDWIEHLREKTDEFVIEDKGLYTLQDYYAIRFTFHSPNGDERIRGQAVSIDVEDTIYTMILSQYDDADYQTVFKEILKTLEFPEQKEKEDS